jgi:hypothetical protein
VKVVPYRAAFRLVNERHTHSEKFLANKSIDFPAHRMRIDDSWVWIKQCGVWL